MGRAPCCDKVGLKKGRWSAEEDAILINYLIKQKNEAPEVVSWRSLPKKAGLLRCGKSCRLRWINYLRSDLRRGNFSSDEQDTIVKLHASLGNKWSAIANQLEGRTDNEIKNYWNATLCRRSSTPASDTLTNSSQKMNMHADGKVVNLTQTISKLQESVSALGKGMKKRGGRTSRAAMKKNKFSHYGKSNKYHQLATSVTNYTNGFAATTTTTCSALSLQMSPHEDQASSAEALKGGMVLNVDELPVEGDMPNNDCLDIRCNANKDKETMEEISSNLNQAALAANDTLHGADWDWINDHIVLQDAYDNQVWSDELDGTITWLWEYHEYAHHH